MKSSPCYHTLIFFFFLLLPSTLFSKQNNELITELQVTNNDSTFRYLYLYDNQGNKVLETKYYQQLDTWNFLSKTEWMYQQNNCVLQRLELWKNNKWETTYQIEYGYDTKNLMHELHKSFINNEEIPTKKIDYKYSGAKPTLKQTYFYLDKIWYLQEQISFRYSNNNLYSLLTDVYVKGTIKNQYSSSFTYNSMGSLSNQITKYKNINENIWINEGMCSFFYSSENRLLKSQRNKIWIEESSEWQNSQMIDYEYDDSFNLLTEEYKIWKVMFWVDNIQYRYFYNQQKNLIKKSLYVPLYNQWRSLVSINYSDFKVNSANFIASSYDFWGGTTGQFTSSYIPFLFNGIPTVEKAKTIQLSYLPITDVKVLSPLTHENEIQPIYPNPSNGIYYLDTQLYKIDSWMLMDLNARVLKMQSSKYLSGVIDISEFSEGIYIIQLKSANRIITQKLIKY